MAKFTLSIVLPTYLPASLLSCQSIRLLVSLSIWLVCLSCWRASMPALCRPCASVTRIRHLVELFEASNYVVTACFLLLITQMRAVIIYENGQKGASYEYRSEERRVGKECKYETGREQ